MVNLQEFSYTFSYLWSNFHPICLISSGQYEAGGCLCLYKGVQSSANGGFNNVHTEWMSVDFPSCYSAKLCVTCPRAELCLNITEEKADKEVEFFLFNVMNRIDLVYTK